MQAGAGYGFTVRSTEVEPLRTTDVGNCAPFLMSQALLPALGGRGLVSVVREATKVCVWWGGRLGREGSGRHWLGSSGKRHNGVMENWPYTEHKL